MNFKTADGIDVNIEKLAQIFPEAVTETKDANGKLVRVANLEALKALLEGKIADPNEQECYEFIWPGKSDAIMEAAKSITKTLRPCPEESKNWDSTQNLYIEGDNLEALKLLQQSYLGKVKMIYIDPVSYIHLRAHETVLELVCRLLLEKKKIQRGTIPGLSLINLSHPTTQ